MHRSDVSGPAMNGPFLSAGFRPFYLGAAGFALLSVPVWILSLATTAVPLPGIPPVLWHGHEMIFGFAAAVIVGFLLTAARNWTGLPTADGNRLGALFGLWLAARAANWLSPAGLYGLLPVLLDTAFLLAATLSLAAPILRARNRRNYFAPALLLGLSAAAGLHGLGSRGVLPAIAWLEMPGTAMDMILLLMIVVGGRVIPAFSSNAISGLNPLSYRPIEILVIASALGLLLIDLLVAETAGTGWQAFFLLSALLHLLRLLLWKPWRTVRNPLLLALPLAYLWIPVHFLLRALEPTLALHALTVGAMASLMLAMMTRSALGHTGRALAAGPAELVCFLCIHLAAISRVFGPLIAPAGYLAWLWLAAIFWTLAFGTFFLAYWPFLTRPRADAQMSR